jgi:hypothetical protein
MKKPRLYKVKVPTRPKPELPAISSPVIPGLASLSSPVIQSISIPPPTLAQICDIFPVSSSGPLPIRIEPIHDTPLDISPDSTPLPPIIEEEKKSIESIRGISPFRRASKGGFFSFEKKKVVMPVSTGPPQVVQMFDSRIPSYIPEGALLIGGKNGSIVLLPKPYCSGLVLMANEDSKAEWNMVYPPKL